MKALLAKPATKSRVGLLMIPLLALVTGCGGGAPSPAPATARPWTEQEVTFPSGAEELYGVLTLPAGEGPFPAVVLISGSVGTTTGVRSGATAQYLIDHAHKIARGGFAALRYDPPGVGRSTGQAGFETLDSRAEEAAAALRALRSRPEIRPDRVGLMGSSQGAWVIAMAAARYPEEVAFVISVSGAGVSVAEQQVHSIEAQSRAAGMTEEQVATAVLFGRLLVDWQLAGPIFREANRAAVQALGEGPWARFSDLVYEPGEITPAEGLKAGIEILESVQDEPWAKFLYLKELYLPQLESIPPEQVEALKAMAGQSLLEDPQEYWTRVRCPVLAFFGADDLLQPTEKSAALYEQYLTQAGNEDFEIVVLPGVGHSISLPTPGYAEALAGWLAGLYPAP
jgi:pimeloyl-ACP methyl ester carboxylesterase